MLEGIKNKYQLLNHIYFICIVIIYRRAALISINTNIFNLPFAVVALLTVVTVVSSEAIKIKHNLMWYQRLR